MTDLWENGIERMLVRVRDTAQRVGTGFPRIHLAPVNAD
jgi:hypothetical protein